MQVRPSTRRHQIMRLAGWLSVLAVVTTVSLRQAAPPQFALRPGAWSWWFTPIKEDLDFRTSVTAANLRSVFFLASREGWAVGPSGTILHTEDGGSSWQAQESGTENDLSSVSFVSPLSGWAVGSDGTILHTEEGGRSWRKQESGTERLVATYTKGGMGRPRVRRLSLSSVSFVTALSGWAVGEGTILHTDNGGGSWREGKSVTLEDMAKNGGSGWQAQWTNPGFQLLFSASFPTPQSGWAVGSGGTILHTEDGGSHWLVQNSGQMWT